MTHTLLALSGLQGAPPLPSADERVFEWFSQHCFVFFIEKK